MTPHPDDDDPRLHFNGLTAAGTPLLPPVEPAELGRRLLGLAPDWRLPPKPDERGTEDPTRRPRYGVREDVLEEAGWAVVHPAGRDLRVVRALDPLCDLRQRQAGDRYKEALYVPGEDLDAFLGRLGAPLGLADPDRLPYYVLLVGGPEEIPWELQHGLDQTYAVGRISFDTPAEYAAYARTVVDAEEGRLRRPRQAVFFAPEHDGDRATRRTRRDLVEPLAEHVEGTAGRWQVRTAAGADAHKAELGRLFAGDATPALLFAGGHGLRLGPGHGEQAARQGALVTADWTGAGQGVTFGPEHCFAAADLGADAVPAGLVAFLFACYGAGTPERDSFWQQATAAERIAGRPFVAALAQRLLGRTGGALAVLGHVDRAWTTSFDFFGDRRQRLTFESVLDCLLDGKPVGAAMEYLSQFTADMATELATQWGRRHRGERLDEEHFARLWLAHADARSFVVFGDPAVRLAV